jgi:TolB protein
MWAVLGVVALLVGLMGCGGDMQGGTGAVDTAGKPPPPTTPCRIAFQRDLTNSSQVFTMYTNGTGVAQLTKTGSNFGPSWSPDGRQICFVSNREGTNRLYVMDADGRGQVPLGNPPTINNPMPDWCRSSAVSKIAFTRNMCIYLADPAGSEQQVTFGNPSQDFQPTLSANGQFLAFFRQDTGGVQDGLDILRLSDGETWQLVSGGLAGYNPDWSPSGDRIAYNFSGLWCVTMDAATGQLTGGPHRVVPSTTAYSPQLPTWSADGASIAFCAEVGKSFDDRILTVVAPSPGGSPNQPVDIGRGWAPDWSPVLP